MLKRTKKKAKIGKRKAGRTMLPKREKKELSVRVGLPKDQYMEFAEMTNMLEYTNPTQVGRRLILKYMEERRDEYLARKKTAK